MKRESKLLLQRSTDSLLLAIDHFNRPWECSRHEATLILLDRAFELILKAAILQLGDQIRESGTRETIGFDKCVRKAVSDANLAFLTDDQAITLQVINSLRNSAQHHLVDTSEQQLYIYAQGGLSVYSDVLRDVFDQNIEQYLPERALPVSPNPPTSIDALIETELHTLTPLIARGSRKRVDARAKLRALSIADSSIRGEKTQPSDHELDRLIGKLQTDTDWTQIFPGIATLQLTTDGSGIGLSLRITKREGEAVHLVQEGTPGATTIAVKRVNELDYYSLGLTALARKCNMTPPKTLAVVRHLSLQESDDYYKEIRVGSQIHKRYSSKALDKIKQELPNINLPNVWELHGSKRSTTK